MSVQTQNRIELLRHKWMPSIFYAECGFSHANIFKMKVLGKWKPPLLTSPLCVETTVEVGVLFPLTWRSFPQVRGAGRQHSMPSKDHSKGLLFLPSQTQKLSWTIQTDVWEMNQEEQCPPVVKMFASARHLMPQEIPERLVIMVCHYTAQK